MKWSPLAVLLCVVTFVAPPLAAQETPTSGEGVLDLFFDCQGSGCRDMDFFRREVPVVNWVRDREDSDLHVLITSQVTGGGGRLYTLAFIGRRALAGEDQELTVGTPGDATTDEQREAIAARLRMGLVRYLVGTPAAEDIVVSLGGGTQSPGAGGRPGSRGTSSADDPWNFWVFRIGGNGFVNGESSVTGSNFSGNIRANRTTDAWKFSLTASFSRRRTEFDVGPDDPPVVSLIEDWSTSSLLVKSLSPQWSVGARVGSGRSTRRNEDFRWNVSPGIEYNFVPYSESSRRAFTLQALVNVRHWDYELETVYFQTAETRVAASLTAALNQIQPWGRVNLSLTGSQYLHDANLNQISLNGSISVRLFKGLSVNVGGSYAFVNDQLFLPAGGVSAEEILTRQRQLQTNFSYFTSFGFSYQFGSIFNNVVNPRFGGGEGNRIFFF